MFIHRLSDSYRVVEEEGAFFPQVRYVYPALKQIDWGSLFEGDHQKVRRGSLPLAIAFMWESGCDIKDKESDASVEQAASLIVESGLLTTYTIEIDRIQVYLEYKYVIRVAQFPDLDQWFIPVSNLERVVQRVIRQLKYRQWFQSTKRFSRYELLFIPHRIISACSLPGTMCPHQHGIASSHEYTCIVT